MTDPRKITADAFGQALEAAGIVSDLSTISRIVIDAQAGHVLKIHVQRFGDERLIDIAAMLISEADYATP